MEKDPFIVPYLDKLGLKVQGPSLAYLNQIIRAHQKIISFNNLAVYFNPGKILDLELKKLFEKVILRGEGGYCFENNKVFFHLLQALDFSVEAKAARVIYDRTDDVPRTHRTTVVTLEGQRYLVDVGFGKDVPPQAVPFGVQVKKGHQVISKGSFYIHQLVKKDTLINLYVLDDGTYQESDFMVANYYTNTHLNSKFTREVIVTRKEENLIEFINGRVFSRIQNGVREDRQILNQKEFDDLLKHFGVHQTYDFNKLP